MILKKYLYILLSFVILRWGVNASLAENVLTIPEVNLRNKATVAKLAKETSQTTTITRNKIKASPLTNLQALLKQEQSVVRLTPTSGDSSQTAVSLRGFGDNASANSLILVDGFPLTNASRLTPNLNTIALMDIARIDVIAGSQGSLWGDQAVGGIVNIITRHPEECMLDAALGVGSFNKFFFGSLIGNKFKQGFFFKVIGFAQNTHNYRAHNQQAENNIRLEAGRDYANGTISLTAQTFNERVNFPGGLSEHEFKQDPRQAINYENYIQYKTKIYQILNKQSLNSNFVLETRIRQHNVRAAGWMFLPTQFTEWQNNIEPRLVGVIAKHKIVVGYLAQNSGYHLFNRIVENKAQGTQQNLFGQTIWPLFINLDATLGMRLVWQKNSGTKLGASSIHTSDRIFVTEQGLTFRPNEKSQFFLRRDGNFRFPKANEILWTSPGVLLESEKGVSYEMGGKFLTSLHHTQLSIYRLILRNEIAFDPTTNGQEPFGTFRNIPRTVRDGFTLTEHFRIISPLTFDAQLNYVRARFAAGAFAGKTIPAVPAFNGNAGIAYEFISKWFLKYYLLYTGSRFASEDNQNIAKQLPGYWLNSLALQYRRHWLTVNFEIENLFNQRYAAFTFYDTNQHANLYFPGAGRSYLLTCKMNLI